MRLDRGTRFGSGTLVRATPLILTGLAVAVAFRAGVFNIGAEGQFVVGAAAATAAALVLSATLPAIVDYCRSRCSRGAIAGARVGVRSPRCLRLRFQVLEVISTIMLNFVAGVSRLVSRARPDAGADAHLSADPDDRGRGALAAVSAQRRDCTSGFAIAVAACVVAWWVIRFTAGGFRLRAVGANPNAARSAGQIDVERVTMRAFLVSGALAGLAGAIEVSRRDVRALREHLARLRLHGDRRRAARASRTRSAVIGTGILFGALEAGGAAMQRDAGVPSVVVSVIEAGVILALVALRTRSHRPSGADRDERRDDRVLSKRRCGPRRRSRSPRSAKWSSSGPGSSTSVSRESFSRARSARSSARRTAASPAAIAPAMRRGVVMALVFALFAVWLRADQIITGTAVTLLAVGLTGTLYRTLYGAAGAGAHDSDDWARRRFPGCRRFR